jgi:HEPN domain-containing protein
MTEFTKTKIHFALALLGTLFAVHPYIEQWKDEGFLLPEMVAKDVKLKVEYAYAFCGGLLALAVYFYATSLMTEHVSSRSERLGNFLYAVGILIFPLYGLLWLSYLGEQQLIEWDLVKNNIPAVPLKKIGDWVPVGVAVFWLLTWQFFAWRVRRRLGGHDQSAKVEQLANQELAALNQVRDMETGQNYDLAVIQAWKALEARLSQALLRRGIATTATDAQSLLDAAAKAGIITGKNREQIEELRQQWNVAVSTQPISREAAEKALAVAREILSTIALPGDDKEKKPRL